jgi:hypothetical protein
LVIGGGGPISHLSSVICHSVGYFLFRYARQIQETLHALCGAMAEEPSLIGEFE